MRRILIASVLVLVASVTAETATLSSEYIVPVVARNPGLAGADWRTELCITNPSATDALIVQLLIFQNPFYDRRELPIRPLETLCSDDFLLEWFGLSRWQGFLIVTSENTEYPELSMLSFATKVRVYNVTASGTYGLSVPSFPIGAAWDDIIDRLPIYHASGIQHWGAAGIDGMRTSVGAAGLVKSYPLQIMFSVLDNVGNLVWTKTIWWEQLSQVQFSLPKTLVIQDGSLRVEILDDGKQDHSFFPYFTVTDNETGDGYLVPAGVLSTFELEGCIGAGIAHRGGGM